MVGDSRFLRRRIGRRLAWVVPLVMLAAWCSLPIDVSAQAKVGTTGAQFLELGVSARAMGMAENHLLGKRDIKTVFLIEHFDFFAAGQIVIPESTYDFGLL